MLTKQRTCYNKLFQWTAKYAATEFYRYKYKEINMPTISMFFGIVVSLYFIDNRKHKRPHIHVKYQDSEAVISIPNGELLDGELPPAKMRLVLAWIEIHKDELMADWDLAASGQQPFKIDPLR
ncbi:MAG TPA: DUF4160 domain-containing protein [Candidatus Wujingus californicus]